MDLYKPWLDELFEVSDSSELSVFTLNYDGFLREVIKNLGKRFNLVDGFRFEENLDHKVFDQEEYDTTYSGPTVKVFCLHGELDWKFHKSGYVVRKGKGWWLNTSDRARSWIYPVKGGKYPYEEPFKTLYSYFRNKLATADKALVVGYSFRDLPLNDALNDKLQMSPEFEVVVLFPHAENLKEEGIQNIDDKHLGRFRFISGGFEDEESRKRVIATLRGEKTEETPEEKEREKKEEEGEGK